MVQSHWIRVPIILVVSVAAFGLFCVSLPVAIATGVLSLDGFISLVALLFSWPVAVLILGVLFLSWFREPIESLFRNIRSVQFRGAQLQMETPTPVTDEENPEDPDVSSRHTETQSQELHEFINTLLSQIDVADEERSQREKQLAEWAMTAYVWKFTYLNLFYVPQTKQILRWFAMGPYSEQVFHQMWQAYVPSIEQRKTILKVLTDYQMLTMDGQKYLITPEGVGFLQYIGSIASTPT